MLHDADFPWIPPAVSPNAATARGHVRRNVSGDSFDFILPSHDSSDVADVQFSADSRDLRPAEDTRSDAELARQLQDQLDGEVRYVPPRRRRPTPEPATSTPECSEVMVFLADFLGTGACLGCATGLQLAVVLGLGNCGSWITALGGAVVGHMTMETPHFRRHHHEDDEWSSADVGRVDVEQHGLDSAIIDDHTVGHAFTGPATSSRGNSGGGAEETCRVCMDAFQIGEPLRVLPCLHRYHQGCIHEWLKRSPVCPICMRNITAAAAVPGTQQRQQSRSRDVSARLSRVFNRVWRRSD